MAVAIMLLCPLGVYSQNSRHAFEFGLEGSAINHTRIMVSDFHQTRGGDYVFTLEEKQLYGGSGLYAAYQLNDWIYLDGRATLGIARYYDSGNLKQGFSVLAGPGLQFRPHLRNQWVEPYVRLGVNYYHKNFPTSYFGQFNGDITKEGIWKAEDTWNKGNTLDKNTFIPLSLGIGMVSWLGNRVGIRMEGDFLRSITSKGANSAVGTAGIVFRFGGKDKRASLSGPERIVERVVEKEIVKEVPVETVKEIIKEVPCERTLASLMDNVTFDFDKADLTTESLAVLDEVAAVLASYPDERYLVSGYTDARGSYSYNEALSFSRAKAVYDALLERGVSESRLCYRGFGKKTAVIPGSADDLTRRGDRKVVLERVTWDPLWDYLKSNQK